MKFADVCLSTCRHSSFYMITSFVWANVVLQFRNNFITPPFLWLAVLFCLRVLFQCFVLVSNTSCFTSPPPLSRFAFCFVWLFCFKFRNIRSRPPHFPPFCLGAKKKHHHPCLCLHLGGPFQASELDFQTSKELWKRCRLFLVGYWPIIGYLL